MHLPQHLNLELHLSPTIDPYLIDQLHFMQEEQENDVLYQSRPNYLSSVSVSVSVSSSFSSLSSSLVSYSDRQTMIQWSYDIVSACSIKKEIALIGLEYFDRYMSRSCDNNHHPMTMTMTRRSFQLTYITCLILALKTHGGLQVESNFVSDTICQNLYSSDEINKMECEVLNVLSWKLNNGSIIDFVRGMFELLPPLPSPSPPSPSTEDDDSTGGENDDKIHEYYQQLQKLQQEILHEIEDVIVFDYNLIGGQRPSKLAFATLLTILSRHDDDKNNNIVSRNIRIQWMANISIILGMNCTDTDIRNLCSQMMDSSSKIIDVRRSSPSSSSSSMIEEEYYTTTTTSYCMPIEDDDDEDSVHDITPYFSSTLLPSPSVAGKEEEYDYLDTYYPNHLYLDTLSMTSDCSSSSSGSGSGNSSSGVSLDDEKEDEFNKSILCSSYLVVDNTC